MSTASITLPPSGAATRATPRVWRAGLAASATWLALAALTALWPNKEIGFSDWAYTHEFAILCAVLAAALLALALAGEHGGRLQRALRPAGPWLAAAGRAWP